MGASLHRVRFGALALESAHSNGLQRTLARPRESRSAWAEAW